MSTDPKRTGLLLLITFAVGAILTSLSLPNSLDARLYYSPEQLETFWRTLSNNHWQSYKIQALMDELFLVFYSLFLMSLFSDLKPSNRLKYLILLPGLFDAFETTSILLHLYGFKTTPQWLGLITFFKWSSGGLIALFTLWTVAISYGATKTSHN